MAAGTDAASFFPNPQQPAKARLPCGPPPTGVQARRDACATHRVVCTARGPPSALRAFLLADSTEGAAFVKGTNDEERYPSPRASEPNQARGLYLTQPVLSLGSIHARYTPLSCRVASSSTPLRCGGWGRNGHPSRPTGWCCGHWGRASSAAELSGVGALVRPAHPPYRAQDGDGGGERGPGGQWASLRRRRPAASSRRRARCPVVGGRIHELDMWSSSESRAARALIILIGANATVLLVIALQIVGRASQRGAGGAAQPSRQSLEAFVQLQPRGCVSGKACIHTQRGQLSALSTRPSHLRAPHKAPHPHPTPDYRAFCGV